MEELLAHEAAQLAQLTLVPAGNV